MKILNKLWEAWLSRWTPLLLFALGIGVVVVDMFFDLDKLL